MCVCAYIRHTNKTVFHNDTLLGEPIEIWFNKAKRVIQRRWVCEKCYIDWRAWGEMVSSLTRSVHMEFVGNPPAHLYRRRRLTRVVSSRSQLHIT